MPNYIPWQTQAAQPTNTGVFGTPSSSDPFGNLTSMFGAGLGISNQQQAYSGLQNALNQIGPTQMTSNTLAGPGGMSTGYNPLAGQGSINLGSLNPAFSGFAGAAGGGANAYSAGLPSFLSGNALSQLGPAFQNLSGAYGNYGAGMGAANAQLGNLGNFNNTYGGLLSAMRGQMQPQIQQQAYGLQNTLFGNGVADSTGAASGSLAAQNFGRGVGQADASAQLAAFQQALGQQQTAGSLYSGLSSASGNILNNAFNNFGNTNQLISGLNTAGLNNATTAAQGAGTLNTVGLNNYNSGLQSALANSTARNQSLFPYASVANSLAGTQNGMGLFGSALSQAGANGGNPLMSLFNTGRQLYNGYQNLLGGGGYGGVNTGLDAAGGYVDAGGNYVSAGSNTFGLGNTVGDMSTGYTGTPDLSQSAGALGGDFSFSPAGGEAAAATTPIGGGAGSGTMLLPSMLPSSYGAAAGTAAGSGSLGALGTAADTTGMSEIGAIGYGGADAAGTATGTAAAGAGVGDFGALGTMAIGDAGSALSIYNGLRSGTVSGDVGAVLSAANLAKNVGAFTPSAGVGAGLGAVGGALNIYNGLKQGGALGDIQAGLGAAQTYAGASALDSAAGGAGLAGGSSIGAAVGPIGLALAPALYGMSQPAVSLGTQWYNNFGNTVGAGLAPGATQQQQIQAATQLQGLGLDSNLNDVNMTRLMQTLFPYGITTQQDAYAMANQLLNNIGPNMPTGPGIGNSGGFINQA